MKKSKTTLSLVIVAIFTTIILLSGVPTSAAPKKDLKGTVSVMAYSWDVDFYTKLAKEFNKAYPDVKVTIISVDWTPNPCNDNLTTKAAAKNLPDIAYGWDDLTFPISQGWVAPLDKYIDKDPEAHFINPLVKKSYVYNKKTYALPMYFQFNGILVNLDLLDQLNIKKPSYNWTINDFVSMAKKATTKETSGINQIWGFDLTMAGMMSRDQGEDAYSQTKGSYNFTAGNWLKAINLQKQLKAVPGLVSDDLKDQKLKDAGKLDDYDKKFGKDADAVREGKVLFTYSGTWDYGWESSLPFKWDLYPLPSDPSVGYRQPVHADNIFMMKTAKYPEAAFEFLKWMSFGTQGNMFKLNYNATWKDADGKLQPSYYVPVTTESHVLQLFNSYRFVKNGVKYMYNFLGKQGSSSSLFRGDYYKFVPGFSKVEGDIIYPMSDKVRSGQTDAASAAVELNQKANAAIKDYKDKFDVLLKAVQAKETK